jgi:hypothetical protein
MASYPVPQDAVVLLWTGGDPVFHAGLLAELESAGIPYVDKSLGDEDSAPRVDSLALDWKPALRFEVSVQSADFEAARLILEKLPREELANLELPAQDEGPPIEPVTLSTKDENPTVEVWTGMDNRIAQFVAAALDENDILNHLENTAGLTKIYVPKYEGSRAREIVREVTQAASPE